MKRHAPKTPLAQIEAPAGQQVDQPDVIEVESSPKNTSHVTPAPNCYQLSSRDPQMPTMMTMGACLPRQPVLPWRQQQQDFSVVLNPPV